MKLSEAIRLGSMLRPQAFGEYVHYRGRGGTCALGAALEAASVHTYVMCQEWPFLLAESCCPISQGDPCFIVCRNNAHVIRHLNDDHRWTREQIAHWVATIEPADGVAEPSVEFVATEAGQ